MFYVTVLFLTNRAQRRLSPQLVCVYVLHIISLKLRPELMFLLALQGQQS